MKKIITIAMSMLLLSACTKDEICPPNTTPTAGISGMRVGKLTVERPFKVSFYSTVDTDPSIPPTPCTGDLQGLANAGYFLHGTGTEVGILLPGQSRGQDVSCNLSFATALLTTSVAGQLAASNGDLIYYTANDEIDVFNLLTGGGPTGSITGLWTITGGTGRFEGATGSFAISGPVDFPTGTFSFDGEGTISY